MSNAIKTAGYSVISLDISNVYATQDICRVASKLLSVIGQPVKIFSGESLWREVGVDTSRPPNKSRGVGSLPLHIDFVNTQHPPDMMALLCIREDPQGGGDSLNAQVEGISQDLSFDAFKLLSQPVYRDGAVYDLQNVGSDINPFPIFSDDSPFHCRFTGHLLNSVESPPHLRALEALAAQLEQRTVSVRLKRGDLLIADQRRVLYGRLPLGPNQEKVPADSRRLMMLTFLKVGE
jgi:hypothetical protein